MFLLNLTVEYEEWHEFVLLKVTLKFSFGKYNHTDMIILIYSM